MIAEAVSSAHGESADAVYAQLRSDIVEHRYDAGERLVEASIASRLGVSRTPVRDALRRLATEGLVVVEPNRGAAVRSLDLADVVDLYGLRARLESYAAELAAQRATPDELAGLRRSVEGFTHVCEAAGDAPADLELARRLSAANAAVHDGLVAAGHHQRLGVMLARTVDTPLVFGAFRIFGPAERRRSDLFHRLVLDAIERGDGTRAGELMAEHVAQGCDAVIEELRRATGPR